MIKTLKIVLLALVLTLNSVQASDEFAKLLKDSFKFDSVQELNAVPKEILGPIVAIGIESDGKVITAEGNGEHIGKLTTEVFQMANSTSPVLEVYLIKNKEKFMICFTTSDHIIFYEDTTDKRVGRFLITTISKKDQKVIKIVMK